MELTPRKKQILAEIVRAHIETGEPIGSKILAARLPNAPSTATLRNEMSELCEMGYLEQPHTSAGRLPTSRAYRLYVTELMEHEKLSDEGMSVVDGMLSSVSPDPESIGLSAATILSELTGLPVLVAANTDRTVKVKRVNLMPMGRNAAVIFVIADDGRAKSRLVRSELPILEGLIAGFEKICNEKVCGKAVNDLDKAYLQNAVISSGLDAISMAPLLANAFELAQKLNSPDVKVVGAANLFTICDGEYEAKRILELLQGDGALKNIFSTVTDDVGIIFGDDTEYQELKPTGMIVANYGDGRQYGKIALIGPTRMSYGELLPSVQYLADRVGNIMSEILKGLEE